MKCERARNLVMRSMEDAGLARHLSSCAECARFAARARDTMRLLAERPAVVGPDPGFAARVVARLPEREPVLGWAALKVLPAATALLVVLGFWAWIGTAPPSQLTTASPTDDLVAWVLSGGDDGND